MGKYHISVTKAVDENFRIYIGLQDYSLSIHKIVNFVCVQLLINQAIPIRPFSHQNMKNVW